MMLRRVKGGAAANTTRAVPKMVFVSADRPGRCSLRVVRAPRGNGLLPRAPITVLEADQFSRARACLLHLHASADIHPIDVCRSAGACARRHGSFMRVQDGLV